MSESGSRVVARGSSDSSLLLLPKVPFLHFHQGELLHDLARLCSQLALCCTLQLSLSAHWKPKLPTRRSIFIPFPCPNHEICLGGNLTERGHQTACFFFSAQGGTVTILEIQKTQWPHLTTLLSFFRQRVCGNCPATQCY